MDCKDAYFGLGRKDIRFVEAHGCLSMFSISDTLKDGALDFDEFAGSPNWAVQIASRRMLESASRKELDRASTWTLALRSTSC